MLRFVCRSCAVVACSLFLAAASRGQTASAPVPPPDEFGNKQTELVGQNAAGFSFTIRFANGKNTFQQGEIIPLELVFSSSKPGAFSIDSAGYDRSGRLYIDRFILDADTGVTDPLEEYFRSQDFLLIGGLRGYPELTAKPYVINAELNEWRRFDLPGKYRLYVISGRPMKGTNSRRDGQFGAISNLLEFEILPATPQWAEQTLQNAIKTIDTSPDKETRVQACRILRFLNTEGAAREMVRRIGTGNGECDYEYQFGLLGSPHRAFIVKEMERELDVPTHPITSAFLYPLGFNAWLLTDPAPLPPFPSEDEAAQASWQLLRGQRRDARQAIAERYLARLAVAATRKAGPALAISLATVFDSTSDAAMTPDLLVKLATVFPELPADRQEWLLKHRWKSLAGPAMTATLRKIYENPKASDTDELRSTALKRLYELAPTEGRPLILKELALAQPRVDVEVLRLLPETELPALEQTWTERLSRADGLYRDRAVQAQLIERYGTTAMLPKLRAVYSNRIGQISCAEQSSVLKYFLRTDEEFGVQMLVQAMASRAGTACYRSQLGDVVDRPMPPVIESAVLDHLNDPDLETSIGAVKLAGKYGSPAGEAKLWERLAAWHQAQEGNRAKLEDQRKSVVPISQESLEAALLDALATSPAWLTDLDKLKRLQQLCLSPKGCADAAEWVAAFKPEISYNARNPSEPPFSVAQYRNLTIDQLKAKLLQFPVGTTFRWFTGEDDQPIDAKIFDDLMRYLTEHGMKLND